MDPIQLEAEEKKKKFQEKNPAMCLYGRDPGTEAENAADLLLIL